MTFNEIRIAITSRMAAWSDAPVAYDGSPTSEAVTQAQGNKTPWTRLTIQHGASFTAGIGVNPHVRHTGLIVVQIFAAPNAGTRTGMELADSIAAHMQYYTSGHLETLAASLFRVGEVNGYFQLNLSIPFRAG
ncbi:MAG: hypothetical protein CL583_07415 [Alteromonadaceae bacterium]|nr:hypothetical protein [Alteromonadaceae bacterium]|tara:strand:- start:4070 stop:4468 length:399 start_codon:yes stop_codon:yes gene_type:complete